MTTTVTHAGVKDKLSCTSKELATQDCRLTSGSYNIRLLAKTIAWNDGTWHTVDEMPLKGEALAWEKIKFEFQGHWPILQFWLWDKGTGESQIQSLHWFTADAEKRRLTILGEGVVRKRRLEPADPPGPKAPVAKAKYLYDPQETHGIKALKNGNLEWQLKDQKKIIERDQPRTQGEK